MVNMQSRREYNLEERYAIKLCFKLGKNSRKARILWGMMRGLGGVRESTEQSWLAKGLGFGLQCWGFKGVQQEIPPEEARTLQIGSKSFPTRQCTCPQLHICHLTKIGIKTVPQPPYSPDIAPCVFWLFPKLRGCRYEIIEISSLTDSLPSWNLLCHSKTDAPFMQDAPKSVWSIPYVSLASFFPSLKQNFIAYRSSKVSDCIFEIHQL